MFCGKGIGVISTQTNWIFQPICNARHACGYGSKLNDPLQQADEDTTKFSAVTAVWWSSWAQNVWSKKWKKKAVDDIYD